MKAKKYRNKKKSNIATVNAKKDAATVQQTIELVDPICETEGFELVHVEFQSETSGKILRLYIDKEGGITLDDCIYISRQVSDILDVSLENTGPYQLEVSSPGFERPLGKIEDYNRFKDKTIRIKASQAINGQKNFKGILVGESEGTIQVLIDDETFTIPFKNISKARLVSNGEN